MKGVLEVFTHENIGPIDAGQTFSGNGYMGSSIAPLASDAVLHDGQIVALVVAENFEAAREGAHRLAIHYEPQPAAARERRRQSWITNRQQGRNVRFISLCQRISPIFDGIG